MQDIDSMPSAQQPLSPRYRWISLAEVALGTFIVIGHNVFHIVPNEVPILAALFFLSFWIRDHGYKIPGLSKPKSWRNTFLMALAAAAILQLGSELVVGPLAAHFWPEPQHVSSLFNELAHNWKFALRNLAIVWIFAGLGEELSYRGYLLNRAADLGSRSKLAYVAAMLFVAVLFGFGHFYKGPAGVLDSTYSGVVLGGVYLLSGRNLWATILAHGLSDTFAIIVVFMGWAS
jgi:uncharacterized protein